MIMLLSLGKDLLTFILGKCIDYNEWDDLILNNIVRISLVCKKLNKVAQNIINKHTYIYNIYQKSIGRPDIVDNNGDIYIPRDIGNHIWFLSIKRTTKRLLFVDKYYYDFYDQSDRYFEENCILIKGKLNEEVTSSYIIDEGRCFTIHYKAKFGQILLLTWYHKYTQKHHHIKMQWTNGDIWIGIMYEPRSDFLYRYEVCIDHGGPIITKEHEYREFNSISNVVSDVWNKPFH